MYTILPSMYAFILTSQWTPSTRNKSGSKTHWQKSPHRRSQFASAHPSVVNTANVTYVRVTGGIERYISSMDDIQSTSNVSDGALATLLRRGTPALE